MDAPVEHAHRGKSHVKNWIVIAAHGAPPTDYPPRKIGMMMALEFMGKRIGVLRSMHDSLDREVRNWKRTQTNDPYKNGVDALAEKIAGLTGCPVIAGYNEFCLPTIPQAIEQAIAQGAMQVIVATTMLTRGGEHSEIEIREIVEEAQTKHPGVKIVYAWPLELERVAKLFADEIARFS